MKRIALYIVVLLAAASAMFCGYWMGTAQLRYPVPANAPFTGGIYVGRTKSGTYRLMAGYFEWQQRLVAKDGYQFKSQKGITSKEVIAFSTRQNFAIVDATGKSIALVEVR